MEIERKYLVKNPPDYYRDFPFHEIEQGYLNTDPVVRIRREDNNYYLTYKGKGLMVREEYNLPLDQQSYQHLRKKTDGIMLSKKRYLIPSEYDSDLTIELDVFSGYYEGLVLAEVEFPSVEAANAFVPPAWFTEDVTFSGKFQNSLLSQPEQKA